MTRHNPAKRYEWAVRYPRAKDSDFALFTWKSDAEAFVSVMKLIDNREYEIVEVEDD